MDTFLESIETTQEVSWPKRGRKPEPIPETIARALHESFSNQSTATVVLPTIKVTTFRNLLSKAGKQLNYRIEHHTEDSAERPGYTVYHFRTRARRKDAGNG